MLASVAWALVALVVLDVACGAVFAPPAAGLQNAGALETYFEYGRSVEGKYGRMLDPQYDRDRSLLVAGWTHRRVADGGASTPVRGASGQLRVYGYGMSFNNRVLKSLEAMDRGVSLELSAGPGATLSHSLTNYLAERADGSNADADVVVLGVLDFALPGCHALTNGTWMFESPAPMSYPRYGVGTNGELRVTEPPYSTLGEFEARFGDAQSWGAVKAQFRRHDDFYNPWIFDGDAADLSTIGRMLRRAYAERWLAERQARYVDAEGFKPETGLVDEAVAMIGRFDHAVRSDGALPVVLLFNTRYGTALVDALGPALRKRKVLFVSSHEIAPPGDKSVFLPDSHFLPKYDRLIARRLQSEIRSRLPEPR